VWDDAELELGNRLADMIAAIFATTTHILDLPARRDLDDSGQAVLDAHLARINPSPAALLDDAMRQHDLLAAAVDAMDDSEPSREDLGVALGEIRNVIDEAPRWAIGSETPVEEIRAWKPRIVEAVGMVAAVRLAWSTAVLARTSP
jgi:hypothetical protein